DRGVHTGRRLGLPDAELRTRLRQPALGRVGDRRRPRTHYQRGGEQRALLGSPRWRRQLRPGDLARLPVPSRPPAPRPLRPPGPLPARRTPSPPRANYCVSTASSRPGRLTLSQSTQISATAPTELRG